MIDAEQLAFIIKMQIRWMKNNTKAHMVIHMTSAEHSFDVPYFKDEYDECRWMYWLLTKDETLAFFNFLVTTNLDLTVEVDKCVDLYIDF
jgi:hypothetical protein